MSRGLELLLEVGTEEIPAGFLPPARAQLAEAARKGLEAQRIGFEAVQALGTPRRLVLHVTGVADRQADAVEEKIGPPVSAAFDAEGRPTRAAEGFARSNGVAVEDLLRVETERGLYVAVRRELAGRPTADVLAEAIPQWLSALRFPKVMRWGEGEFAFARPVHWVVALLGDEVIPFSFGGVESGRQSRGHRFHHPGAVDVMDPPDYFRKMKEAWVVVDPEERRALIREGVEAAARKVGGEPLADEDLLTTVVDLVEYPVPVAGSFEERYLELPRELLILTMKHHQKYFAVVDGRGRLLNHFVAVSNTRARDLTVVARGNERVLRARLADARFFFDEDQKRSLEEHLEGLKDVVFQSKLGTSYEKVERFRALAAEIAERVCPDRKAVVDRIARLAKADLVTQMVYEFPELQGVMGREYALRAGEDPVVARGIEEHYWPAQAGGPVPSTDEAACVSLADKIDTIVGCFGVGLIPTGAADPYALRRQTLGILRILLERGLRLPLGWLVDRALAGLADKLTRPAGEVRSDVLQFFRGRLEGLLAQQNLDADLVAGVLDRGFDDVLDAAGRARALQRARSDGRLDPLAETFKRVGNILKGKEPGEVRPERLGAQAEQALWDAYRSVAETMEEAAGRGDYDAFLDAARPLKAAVDRFFDEVLVMDQDPEVRANRLALLGAVARLLGRVAEFSRIG
ncbi:glycine--tRNA ligase subunit beta [Deferrisoma camini]|uniref:glycine--tRNA ligase subunit beta n=1 Tax=Deferrisoma camini TaxID=1035120 RepID=UPI00046D869D|nr:glycine--tRNA ligase subunit beta [Deferrisoma camini]